MEVCSYASDFTDAEWSLLTPLIPGSHPGWTISELPSPPHR